MRRPSWLDGGFVRSAKVWQKYSHSVFKKKKTQLIPNKQLENIFLWK